MKTFYRLLVLATSFAIVSIPTPGFGQATPKYSFTDLELDFLRHRLQLNRPLSERSSGYQISANPDLKSNTGRVFIHQQLENGEISLAILAPENLTPMAYFGFSVDMKGDLVVVGAPGDNATRTGSAYVFKREGQAWKKVAKLLAEDGGIRDDFGYAVRISGNSIFVGAPGANSKYDDTGAVYVFEQNTHDTWSQVDKLLPQNEKAIVAFGNYIEEEGDHFIIGAEIFNNGNLDANLALAYTRSHGYWEREQQLDSSGEIYRYLAAHKEAASPNQAMDSLLKSRMAKDAVMSNDITVDIAGTEHPDLED